MGCSGINGDPANPPRSPRPMPPLPLGKDGERIAQAADRLGWHWWPSDSYQASENYKGRIGWNNQGTFASKNKWKSIASTDHTYITPAIENGLEVRTNCAVQNISVDNNGKLTGVIYVDSKGTQYFQEAGKVILACNGIGTPRILLNSKSKKFPNGLANSSGLVGKNLMYHPYASATGLFNENDINYTLGPLANIIIVQEFYETDPKRDFLRGYSFQMNRSHGPAHTALGSGSGGVSIPWGKDHHDEFSKRFKKYLGFAIISEDLPELHNRVEIDENLKDKNVLLIGVGGAGKAVATYISNYLGQSSSVFPILLCHWAPGSSHISGHCGPESSHIMGEYTSQRPLIISKWAPGSSRV